MKKMGITRTMQDVKPANISGIKREYLKGKINEVATNSKNKNIRYLNRGINKFKGDYQPRSNLVKDEVEELLLSIIECS
jgi:hypothetical protein